MNAVAQQPPPLFNIASAAALMAHGMANPRVWGTAGRSVQAYQVLATLALAVMLPNVVQARDDPALFGTLLATIIGVAVYMAALRHANLVPMLRPWVLHALTAALAVYPVYRLLGGGDNDGNAVQNKPGAVLTPSNGSIVEACKVQLEDPTSAPRAAFEAAYASISPEKVQEVSYAGSEGKYLDNNVWCHAIVRTRPVTDPYPKDLVRYKYETGEILRLDQFVDADAEAKYRQLAVATP